MSPVVAPGRMAAMPRIIASWVTSISRLGGALDVADRVHAAGIAVPAVEDQRHVDIGDVAVLAAACRSGMPWQTT